VQALAESRLKLKKMPLAKRESVVKHLANGEHTAYTYAVGICAARGMQNCVDVTSSGPRIVKSMWNILEQDEREDFKRLLEIDRVRSSCCAQPIHPRVCPFFATSRIACRRPRVSPKQTYIRQRFASRQQP
jgi:hypothetical protein